MNCELRDFKHNNEVRKIGMVKVMEFEHPNITDGNPLKPHVLYTIASE